MTHRINIAVLVAMAAVFAFCPVAVGQEEKTEPAIPHELSIVDDFYMQGKIRYAAEELDKHKGDVALAYKALFLSDIEFHYLGAPEHNPASAREIANDVLPKLINLHNAKDLVATRLLAVLLHQFHPEGYEDYSPRSLLEMAAESDPLARIEYARIFGNERSSHAVQAKSRKMLRKETSPAAIYLRYKFYRDEVGGKENSRARVAAKLAGRELKKAADAGHPEAAYVLSKKKDLPLLNCACDGGNGHAHLARARVTLANARTVRDYTEALTSAHDDLEYATKHGIEGADLELYMISADNPFMTGAALAHKSIRNRIQEDILFLNLKLIRNGLSCYVAGSLLCLSENILRHPQLTHTSYNAQGSVIDSLSLGTLLDISPGEIRYFQLPLPCSVANNPSMDNARIAVNGDTCDTSSDEELRRSAHRRMKAKHEMLWKWGQRKLQFQWSSFRNKGPTFKAAVCNRTTQPLKNLSLHMYLFDTNANFLWVAPMPTNLNSIDVNQWTDLSWYVPNSIRDMDFDNCYIMTDWD